ncbi:YjcZ family sporulation protein [Alkalihalobacillus sp. MEB130]|nr:YjcZ family sporulation protein [Alkalihalobacillus sp. MEB130]
MVGGFSLIVVLFILLVIVGASWFGAGHTVAPTYGYGCC